MAPCPTSCTSTATSVASLGKDATSTSYLRASRREWQHASDVNDGRVMEWPDPGNLNKRAIYERALQHYLERNLADRIRSFEALSPRDAIAAFFEGIVKRSLGDRERKGCMLVNAALEVAPHDPGLRKIVIEVFAEIEAFFLVHVRAGQANGTITRCLPATTLARHLLRVLMGIRVLARVRPEQDLLESVVAASLALLGNGEGGMENEKASLN